MYVRSTRMQDRVVCKYPCLDGYDGPTTWEAPPVKVDGFLPISRRKHKKQLSAEKTESGTGIVLPRAGIRDDGGRKGRCRAWCFTHPGANEVDVERFRTLKAERIVVGREIGKGGYVHLQGYVRFNNPVSLSWWKLQFPTTHVEWRKGSESQATAYCRKDGDVLIDVGVDCDVRYVGMDKETEAEMVLDEIDAGGKYGQIRQRHRHFVFWHRRNVIEYMSDHRQLTADPDYQPF